MRLQIGKHNPNGHVGHVGSEAIGALILRRPRWRDPVVEVSLADIEVLCACSWHHQNQDAQDKDGREERHGILIDNCRWLKPFSFHHRLRL